MLTAITSYVGLADLGVTLAVRNRIGVALGSGDEAAASRAFSTGLVIVGIGMFVVFTFLSSIILAIGTGSVIVTRTMDPLVSSLAISCIGLTLLIQLPLGLYNAILFSGGKYPTSVCINASLQSIELIALVSILISGGGPISLSLTICFANFLVLLVTCYLAGRLVPRVIFLPSSIQKVEFRSLVYLSLGSIAFPLGNILNVQATRIITGAVLGAEALIVLTALRTLTRITAQFMTIINYAVEPELARSWGSGNLLEHNTIAFYCTRIAVWFGGIMTITVVVMGPTLIDIWLNRMVLITRNELVPYALACYTFAVWQAVIRPAYATNRYMMIARDMILFYGIGAVLATNGGAYIGGVTGIGYALFVCELVMLVTSTKRAIHLSSVASGPWLRASLACPIPDIIAGISSLFRREHLSRT
jgi:O-antigen/teichoic acid export membrane protein